MVCVRWISVNNVYWTIPLLLQLAVGSLHFLEELVELWQREL